MAVVDGVRRASRSSHTKICMSSLGYCPPLAYTALSGHVWLRPSLLFVATVRSVDTHYRWLRLSRHSALPLDPVPDPRPSPLVAFYEVLLTTQSSFRRCAREQCERVVHSAIFDSHIHAFNGTTSTIRLVCSEKRSWRWKGQQSCVRGTSRTTWATSSQRSECSREEEQAGGTGGTGSQ